MHADDGPEAAVLLDRAAGGDAGIGAGCGGIGSSARGGRDRGGSGDVGVILPVSSTAVPVGLPNMGGECVPDCAIEIAD